MAKGALGGFLVGAAVSAMTAGVVSLATMPKAPQPETVEVTPTPGSGFDGVREDRAAELPGDSAPVETSSEAPRAEEPQPDSDEGIAVDTAPAGQPQAESAEATLTPPAEGAESAEAPMATAGEDAPIATAPAEAPAMPAPETEPEAVPALVAPPAPEEPELAALPEEEAEPELPMAEAPAESTVEPETPATEATDTAPQPDTEDRRVPAEIVALDPDTPVSRPKLPTVGADSTAPRIGTPASRLTESDTAEEAQTPAEAEVVSLDPAAPQSPLDANAEPFDNPEDKPLMAIILIDRGDSKIGYDALASFPYPLSFAVDATSPDGQVAMKRYREAGFEVLALTDIPAGATAGDTEMLLRAGLRELPDVVGVMEGDATGLQTDRAVSDQAAALLAETGHGLVLFPKGLNTAQKLASKEGVPAVTVFRDFDGNGQKAPVIRRFLDQAAFKARQQEDGVIMVGRLRAETISALLLWGLQDRAAQVALAPVSAVLKAARD